MVLVHTSQDVSFVHVVRAEDCDSAGSAALQQRPHLMSGAGVHAGCGLVQEQNLTGSNMIQTAQKVLRLPTESLMND